MKREIKCAVFDLDGTLLNTLSTIHYYLNLTLEKYNLPLVSLDETRAMVGDGARLLISRAMGEAAADRELYDRVFADYNAAYNADPYYLTEPYDGIPELLGRLLGQGITLAVLSNKPDIAVKLAVEHFFPSTFTAVQGGVDGTPLKPDPTALLNMLSALGFTPDETTYIGDSEPDVLTAKNAGVAFPIAVTWGFRTADQLVSAGATNLINHPSEIKTDAN